MKIQELVLFPVSAGRVIGHMSETDTVRRYVRAIADELDGCRIRSRIGDAKTPAQPWETAVTCGIGWTTSKKDLVCNRSRVFIPDGNATALGNLLAEALSHWGQTYAGLEHRSCRPVVRASPPYLHIEPFELNGVRAEAYASRLEELGRDIARVIADYAIRASSGAVMKTQTSATIPMLRRVF